MNNVIIDPKNIGKPDPNTLLVEKTELEKKIKDKSTGLIEKIKTGAELVKVNSKLAKSNIGKLN